MHISVSLLFATTRAQQIRIISSSRHVTHMMTANHLLLLLLIHFLLMLLVLGTFLK